MNDDDLAVSGFMGRALICQPRSRIGTRIWTEKPGFDVGIALREYGGLCLQALFHAAETTDTGELKPRTLTLSGSARRACRCALTMKSGERLGAGQGAGMKKIKPQAGRAEEHARRIAGTLELFCSRRCPDH